MDVQVRKQQYMVLILYFSIFLYIGAQILSRPTMPFFLNCKAVRLMSKQYFPSIFMIRTSFGILTQFECLRRGIGGEVLCRFM